MGDGVKKVIDEEVPIARKLREHISRIKLDFKKIVAVIPARLDQGIADKNIQDLGGKPLLAWTIEARIRVPR